MLSYCTDSDNSGGEVMPPDGDVPRTLSGFREATMELDNIYSMFPKACKLSEAEHLGPCSYCSRKDGS